MSQQKALIVVCFLACAIALASAQRLDWQQCSSRVRAAGDRYREKIMNAGRGFTSSMQDAGASASDISSMQQDIDKMTNSISRLTDTSNGFDMGTVTDVWLENMNTMASMMRKSMRPQVFSAVMGAWMDMGNSMMAANTEFMETVTESCVPSSRNYKPRQTV